GGSRDGPNQPSVRATSASGGPKSSTIEREQSAQPKSWSHTADCIHIRSNPEFGKLFATPSPPAVDRRLNIRNFPRNTFSGPHLSRFRASAGFPPRKEMASKFGTDLKNAKLDRILNIPPRRNEVSPLFRRVHFIKFAAATVDILFSLQPYWDREIGFRQATSRPADRSQHAPSTLFSSPPQQPARPAPRSFRRPYLPPNTRHTAQPT